MKTFFLAFIVIAIGFFFLLTFAFGPSVWLQIWQPTESVVGTAFACKVGEKLRYKYQVDGIELEGQGWISKVAVQEGTLLNVFYLRSDPETSWPRDQRGFILGVSTGVLMLALLGGLFASAKEKLLSDRQHT